MSLTTRSSYCARDRCCQSPAQWPPVQPYTDSSASFCKSAKKRGGDAFSWRRVCSGTFDVYSQGGQLPFRLL